MQRLVYTAMSRHSMFAKEIVCAHVFNCGAVPLNPFSMFGYFLYDMVERDLVRSANAAVIRAVDEVWSYGPVADGCLAEIFLARDQQKPIRYYSLGKSIGGIKELSLQDLTFESEELKRKFFDAFG